MKKVAMLLIVPLLYGCATNSPPNAFDYLVGDTIRFLGDGPGPAWHGGYHGGYGHGGHGHRQGPACLLVCGVGAKIFFDFNRREGESKMTIEESGPKLPVVGGSVMYTDPHGKKHFALVTNVFGMNCINLAYVSDSENDEAGWSFFVLFFCSEPARDGPYGRGESYRDGGSGSRRGECRSAGWRSYRGGDQMSGVPASAAGGHHRPATAVGTAGLWNIANILTMVRLLLVPGFVCCCFTTAGTTRLGARSPGRRSRSP